MAGPVPPCGAEPRPGYAPLGPSPEVELWYGAEMAQPWMPPPCTGWAVRDFSILLGLAGRFEHRSGLDGLLRRVAAVSALASVRYWSVTRGRWRDLITAAHALEGPDPAARRSDFAPEELRPGRDLYLWQEETSPAGPALYRLRVLARSPDRLVLALDNVDRQARAFLPDIEPGDVQLLHFFERETAALWRTYSLARVTARTWMPLGDFAASYVNRAVALFRHAAGLPTDRDPPAAP